MKNSEERIELIEGSQAWEFLKDKHYAGRKPSISFAFGWYIDNELKAVCTFGKPASPSLCVGVCGIEYAKNVYELNRLCRVDELKRELSHFVSKCLKILKEKDLIIVSYSDMGMQHHGYIYQACNFIYTVCTKERTDIWSGKHSRHYSKDNKDNNEYRVLRTSKHRYIYFCTKSKKLKKIWEEKLNYKIEKYPKGDNKNYILGDFQKPILVKNNQKVRSTIW